MNLRHRVMRSLFWSAARQMGASLVALAAFVVLTRLLQPEAFGLFALVGVVSTLLVLFVGQGLSAGVVQREDLEPGHADAAFWFAFLMGLGVSVAVFTLADPLASLFHEPRLAPLFRGLSPLFALAGLAETQAAMARRRFAFHRLAARGIVAQLVGAIVGISLAWRGYEALSLVGQQVAVAIAGVVTLWTVSDWRPGFRAEGRHFRELWAYGSKIMAANAAGVATSRLDRLLVGTTLGVTVLGFYEVAKRLVEALAAAFTALAQPVALPAFSRLQMDRERMGRAFIEATRLTALLAVPAFAGLAALAPDLLAAFAGPGWGVSAAPLRVLCLYGLVQTVAMYGSVVINAAGRSGWTLGFNITSLVIDGVAILLLVRFGLVAVAFVPAIRIVAMTPARFLFVRHLLVLDAARYARAAMGPAIAAAAMVTVVLALRSFTQGLADPRILLVAWIGIGVATYGAVLLLIEPALLPHAWATARLALQRAPTESEAG